MAYRAALGTIILLAACTIAQAQSYGAAGWTSPEPNYYAMPAGENGLTAAMYPSPRPTPPLVGQTYITYGPLAPQDFMYRHYALYATNNGCGRLTTTSITYGHRYLFHPSLTNMAPGLHTPAHVSCGM